LHDESTLAAAVLAGGAAYAMVALLFRGALPLGRLSGSRT